MDQLHVIERYRRIDDGKTLEVTFTVEDPGAFTTAWTGRQRYQLVDNTIQEVVCAEGEIFSPLQFREQGVVPLPEAKDPDS
jgi:hypothetical protein